MTLRLDDEFEDDAPRKRRSPALTPDARENELISMAMDEIETQIREGRASSQVLVQFAKMGSARERLERNKLASENALLRKKIEDMDTAVQVKDLLSDALKAFRGYSGKPDLEEEL